MKTVRTRAQEELPYDAETVELRVAIERLQAARKEIVESEAALAAIVGRLDGKAQSGKRQRQK